MASTTIGGTVTDTSSNRPFREEIDEHKGHPGIRATTFNYARINDDMVEMLEKPHPSCAKSEWIMDLLNFLHSRSKSLWTRWDNPKKYIKIQTMKVIN